MFHKPLSLCIQGKKKKKSESEDVTRRRGEVRQCPSPACPAGGNRAERSEKQQDVLKWINAPTV